MPNILWIVAEDLSPIIPPYGDNTVATPNLSRLAAEGIRYTNAFSVSGVCAPSRFTLATGVYTTSAGGHHMRTQWVQAHMDAVGLILYEVVTPPSVRMMSEVLRTHGYYATNNDKTDYQFAPSVTAWDDSGPRASWRGRPPGSPFFSVLNFDITHEGQVWADEVTLRNLRYHELFSARPDPRYFERGPTAPFPNHVRDDLSPPRPPYLPDTPLVTQDLRRVYSNVVELDRQIGAVLDALEADGLLDETIIFFYGDHGGPLPRQKRLLYDSGLRVPLIVRLPDGRGAGTITDRLVSFVDFAPTIFSLAGIEPPNYLEGSPFLGDFTGTARRYVHAAADRLDEHYDMIRAVRDKRFKYLRNFKPEQGYYLPVAYREQMGTMQELLRLEKAGGLDKVQSQWFRDSKPIEELFDTQIDPHEVNNLAPDPAHAGKLLEMRAELDRWMTATQDKGRMTEAALIRSFWPDWERPMATPPTADVLEGKVHLHSETDGASIGYRRADDPEGRWRVYTEPLVLEEGETITAIADRIGFAASNVVSLP
jgi:arylsulfatase A-like enzyme